MNFSEYRYYPFLLELMGYTEHEDGTTDHSRWLWFTKQVQVKGSHNLVTEIKVVFGVSIDDGVSYDWDNHSYSYELTEVALYEEAHGKRLLALEKATISSYEDLLELETHYSRQFTIDYVSVNRVWNGKYRNEYLLPEDDSIGEKDTYFETILEYYLHRELYELVKNITSFFRDYAESDEDKEVVAVKKLQTLIRSGKDYYTDGSITLTLTDEKEVENPFCRIWEIEYNSGKLILSHGKPDYKQAFGEAVCLSILYPAEDKTPFHTLTSIRKFIDDFYDVCPDGSLYIEDCMEKMELKRTDIM